MTKWILGLCASLLLWSPLGWAQSVSLVDCARVRCLTPQDEQTQKLQDQKLAQHRMSSQSTNKSSGTSSSANDSDTRAEILNKDTMTLQERQTYFSKSPWNFVLETGAYRTLDELSDYYSTYSVSGRYQFRRNLMFSFKLGYDSILYSNFDNSFVFNGETTNPRLYGLTDLSLGLSLPSYIKLDHINSIVTFSSSLTLPTSMRSRDRSLVAQLVGSAQLRTGLTPKLNSSVSASLALAHYRYDDANIMGTEINSPLGVILGTSLSYNVWKKLVAYGAFSVHARYDYDSNLDFIQTVTAGTLFPLSEKIQMSFEYMWRDRTVTNDRLFDNNKSYYLLELSYSI